MGGESGTYGGEERCIQGFGGETWGKTMDDLGVDVRVILNWIFKK
jgi:hypothetical protein